MIYQDSNINENSFIRKFTSDVNSSELVWHRDKKSRTIKLIGHNNGWLFQFDNELPFEINENEFLIEKEIYHRLIKGEGELTLKITEH